MHLLISLVPLVAIASLGLASGEGEPHSICYNHFLKKDGCVYGSTCHPCPEAPPKKACESGGLFQHPSHCTGAQTPLSLPMAPDGTPPPHAAKVRRYDTTQKSFYVAGGNGTCGNYNTTTDLGVCLWNGPKNPNGPTVETAGWLNGAFLNNCNKKVYIQRQGRPDTVKFVRVLDSCTFNTDSPEVGCFQVYVTKTLYDLFQPTQEELNQGALFNITWDFAKNVTDDPSPGPA